MNTSHDHREPLNAEERDLAARLARIGPFDGPPPALDAKILAAAHAAAATRKPNRRHHWTAWFGVPPALITGVGVAAAAVLALGLVWQLRPRTGVLMTNGEATGSSEEIFVIAEPAQSTRAPVANPPAVPHEAAPTAPQTTAKATAQPAQESLASANAAATAGAVEPEAKTAPAAAPPSTAEQAPVAAATSDAAADTGFVAEPPPAPAPPVASKHATYTTSARAMAERRERAAVAAAPAAPAAAAAQAAPEPDSATLDRVEVTGSRIRRNEAERNRPLAEVAISEDTHLAAAEWLERIRARRDEGNLDGARQSLRQFRREHPRIRIPDDLRTLLDNKQ